MKYLLSSRSSPLLRPPSSRSPPLTMAAVPPYPSPPSSCLKLESLTHIDITTHSQSELHALSLCSPSAFDLRRTHDLVVPKIDRSLFNESAGSRRQTYSRPRKSEFYSSSSASATPATGHRPRVAGLLPTLKWPPASPDDPERFENRTIINFLKSWIANDPKFDGVQLNSSRFDSPTGSLGTNHYGGWEFGRREGGNVNAVRSLLGFGGERKRKRGRKPKVHVNLDENFRKSLKPVDKDGKKVDLLALANAEDPFGEELMRRTAGLESEEELLAFMRDLGGEWGSRRKRRKIVDAVEFGDLLPVGWKLLLGLKRKEGRAWIYCRRYISPTGQHFITCKEVSSFLQSIFGFNSVQPGGSQKGYSAHQDNVVAVKNPVGFNNMDNQRLAVISSSTLPSRSKSNEHRKDVTLAGIENLAEVKIHDLFECHKCSMTFDEKDLYLQHLLSFHQRTTRRYRLGSSVGDGVIIKDGKYECQFCHKVFSERRRYNGHVGIHVRNYVRKVEEFPGQVPSQKEEVHMIEDLPSKISKMDALIEIAHNSILETSAARPHHELNSGSLPENLSMVSSPGIPLANSDQEVDTSTPLSLQEVEDSMTDVALDHEDSDPNITHENTLKIDNSCQYSDSKIDSGFDNDSIIPANTHDINPSEVHVAKDGDTCAAEDIHPAVNQLEGNFDTREVCPTSNQSSFDVKTVTNYPCAGLFEDYENDLRIGNGSDFHVGFNTSFNTSMNEIDARSVRQTSDEHLVQSARPETSIVMVSPPECLPAINTLADEAEGVSIDKKGENLTALEELKLEELESFKYSFINEEESLLPVVPMDLINCIETQTFTSSSQYEPQEVVLNIGVGNQLTVCVWCGIEFTHEALDSELQSDSVGFMCPNCKAKISGQLNLLDGGSPLDA